MGDNMSMVHRAGLQARKNNVGWDRTMNLQTHKNNVGWARTVNLEASSGPSRRSQQPARITVHKLA